MSQCKKFTPNIFYKTKCSNCFRQKEEHSAEALESNRASRSVARRGYLFVAPDWDFSVPLNRTKRWQRRWFVLYDDGELNYSVDEHPDTVPQGSVDMCKVLEVTGAEQVTGHPHSLALTSPDRVTFVKATSREEARWWAELLAVFPRRHKRSATFPGGRASPSLPQLGRSASPQPPRPRDLPVTGPSPRANFETPPLKEERESPAREHDACKSAAATPARSLPIETPAPGVLTPYLRPDYLVSSGSPPTRDKLRCDDKARARTNWRNERLRDIATSLTEHRPPAAESTTLTLPAEGLLHLKKGWLWQKITDSEWIRRWTVLCYPTIQLFQDQDEQNNAKLTIELSAITNCVEVPTNCKYGFEIRWSGQALILSAVTQSIRYNWLQALRQAANLSSDGTNTIGSPISPTTPKSLLASASSDEEYKTASEGGRRGSEDWGELSPSPPLNRLSFNKVKDRARLRPRLPRCQSRHSTVDSTSTDELDCAKEPDSVHVHNAINAKQTDEIAELHKKLQKAEDEARLLQEEIARLKKFQSDAAVREKKSKEMLSNLEQVEIELNQRNSQMEIDFLKEQRALQRRLLEAEYVARLHEEKCDILAKDLQVKQKELLGLQDEVFASNKKLNEERDETGRLHDKIRELEGKSNRKSKVYQTDSINELIDINMDIDVDEMNPNELKEYCLDLQSRFERAVQEIRAMKRALRDCEEKCDVLEITNGRLQGVMEAREQERESEVKLLSQRLDHLTTKLIATEKQLKAKSKSEARDKRKSLSLKGRESFSINKELEDKITELEAKIIALERGKSKRAYKRDRSSDRSSPVDKSLRRNRRKSLDSATTSESMKLLMRLSSLETKVTNASDESLNTLQGSTMDLSAKSEQLHSNNNNNKSLDFDVLLSTAKLKVNECLNNVYLLKNHRKRASSPNMDKLVAIENSLNELLDILNKRDCAIAADEIDVINTSAGAVVKQLQNLLVDKLASLAEKKRLLKENNNWDTAGRLQILAEKVAYENILVNRIQEALVSPATGEAICERLANKEIRETACLIIGLQNKLNNSSTAQQPSCRTSAEYLSKILAKCLVSAAHGFKSCKNFVAIQGTSINLLCDEKRHLDSLLASYKSIKLPQLAESLALETVNQSCRIDSATNEMTKNARDVVDAELVRSEVDHVFLKAARMFQSNLDADHAFFFSFFASERAALELWSDSVGEHLSKEINKSVAELTELYQNNLNKFLKQNWGCRVESEHNSRITTKMLHEYAEVIAHKALIDARIAVLNGQYVPDDCRDSRNSLDCWLENEKYWSLLEDQSLLQINQSLEAEFNCMIDRFSEECYALISRPELEELVGLLNEMSSRIADVQKHLEVPVNEDDAVVENWNDVCQKCTSLKNSLEDIHKTLNESTSKKYNVLDDERPIYLRSEYLPQVENLHSAYRRALATCQYRHKELDVEQLQQLCERVLATMEQWYLRTINELREAHSREVEILKQEKEQALAEETQATLAALDAMRKAHVAEVQREVAKFKQDFIRQHRDRDRDLIDFSEKLSMKSLEVAALEERLDSATRQLANAQQHILKLERNPQIPAIQN